MRNQFDRQLNTLNGELIQMGHMVEQAIEHAIEAMVHQDAEKARQNMEFDSEVDQQEKDIETLCMKLLMKQQPVARDLRLISAALKMITDMERIGDQAADISELALCLVNEKELPMMDRMKQMSQECMLMVMKALEAFVAKDIEMAKKVIARDDVIDAMFDDTKKEVGMVIESIDNIEVAYELGKLPNIISLIRSNPEEGACATDLLMIAKYFERIGDHACNIAEWVIFSINGTHPTINPEPVL